MASEGSIVRRIIRIIFDRASADQVSAQLTDSLTTAGKTGATAFLKELKNAFATKMAELKVALASGLIDQAQFRQQGDAAAQQFNQGLISGLQKAQAAGELTNSEFIKLSGNLKKVGEEGLSLGDKITAGAGKLVSWAAGFFAVQAIIGFLKSSFDAAEKARQSFGALATAIEDTGAPLEKVGGAADATVDRLSKLSQFTRIDLRAALARLVSDTGDASGAIDHLGLVADVAAARHVDLQTATDFVAKAMEGNAAALKKAGIAVDANLPLVDQLATRYHGAAEKARELDGGTSDLAKSWDELKVSIGEFIERVNSATGVLHTLSETFTGLGLAIQHPIASFKLWLAIQTGGTIDAATLTTLTQGQMTTATAAGVQQRVKVTKDGLAAIVAAGVQAGAQQESDHAKLAKALTIAEQNLAAVRSNVIQQNADGTLSITEVGEQRLIAAETAASQARAALAAKAGKDRAKDSTEAQRTFTEIQQLAEADRLKLLDQHMQEVLAKQDRYNKLILQLEVDAGKSRNVALAAEIAEAKRLRDKAVADLVASQITAQTVETPAFSPVKLPGAATAPDNTAAEQVLLAGMEARNAATERGTEAIKEYNRQQEIEKLDSAALNEAVRLKITITQNLIDKIHKLNVVQVAGTKQAKDLTAVQSEMLSQIEEQMNGLASAWSEGGFSGIAAYARQKARLLFAEAIAYEAESLAAFAFGQVGPGAKFQAAAIAAGAGGAAMAAIGGGVGGPTSSASAATGGAGTGASAVGTASVPAPSQEVNIYISGNVSSLSPKFQQLTFTAYQQARERYGDNAHIRVIRSDG